MAIDWFSPELDHRFTVKMVDPIDHNSELGILDVYASGSVRYDSTTDTVASAVINAVDWTQWIENAWIRIEHTIEGTSFKEVLGTFLVWDEGASYGLDSKEASPQLYSSLMALSYDYLYNHILVGKGASLKNAMQRVCDSSARRYEFASDVEDYRFVSPRLFDAGDSRLDTLINMGRIGNIDVRPSDDGYISFVRHVPAATKSSIIAIDCNSSRTIVHEGSVRPISDKRQVPNRSVAVFKGDEESDTVTAYADVDESDPISPHLRGYVVAEIHELDSEEEWGTTALYAQARANEFLITDSKTTEGYAFSCSYIPIRNDDVISFCPPGESKYQNLKVTSVDLDLGNWTMSVEAHFV